MTNMYTFMQSMDDMHDRLCLPHSPEKHPNCKSIAQAAKVIYESGVLATAIIAGVNLVEEFANKDIGKAYAATFLAKHKNLALPQQLVKRLRDTS